MKSTSFLLVLIFLLSSLYGFEDVQNFSQYLPKVVQMSTNSQWQIEFSRKFGSLYDCSAVSQFSLGLLSSIIKNKSTFPQKPDQAAQFMMNYLVQIDREQKSNPRFLAVKLKFDRQLTLLNSADFVDFQMADWEAIAAEAGIVIPKEKRDDATGYKEVLLSNMSEVSDEKIKKDKVKTDKIKVDKVKEDKVKPEKVKEDKVKESKVKTK